jgi:hypothetical protein
MSLKRQFDGSPLQRWTAIFFAMVMAGFGFVQAVHVHDALAGQSSPASHCSLCMVAHSAAVITPASAAPAPVLKSVVVVQSEPQHLSRLHVTSSFIRPPPDDL